jgi:sugar O-acyltransferase (sialic acid O-acetyltransferase NeuD family)
MNKKLIIFGNGEIAEIAFFYFRKFSNYNEFYFSIDEKFIKEDNFCSKPIIPFDDIEKKFSFKEYDFHVALSYQKLNQVREKKYFDVKDKGFKLASFVSENSHNNLSEISYGENCLILENQTIQNGVKIGNNVMIWSGNHIGHQSEIGDHSYISSHVVISGHCKIGARCFLGVNSSVSDFCKIEEDCFVGMGANINKNLKKNSTALNRSTEFYDSSDKLAEKIKKNYFKF